MTEYKRYELLDGVYLTAVQTDLCAESCLSMTLLTQLSRETAAMNAVLPNVLLRGSSRLPDAEAIASALAEVQGSIEPTVRKLGEVQAVGLRALFAPNAFEQMARELTAMLLSPNTRGGLLRPDWVKDEAALLKARIEAQAPDCETRLIEEMCCYEDYALSPLGDADAAASIHYQKLTRHYHDLVAASPLEIFYCGTTPPRAAAQTLTELLSAMLRGEPDEELGTDVRMNSIDAEPRFSEETARADAPCCIGVGWRLGDQMEDPDLPALELLAACLEQMLRAALDPGARMRLDLHKGILTLTSPLSVSVETARAGIDAQLALLAAGGPAPETRSAALTKLTEDLRAAERDAVLLEEYWLRRAPLGLICSPEELTGLLHEVTPAEISYAARGLECDMVYVRRPEPEDEPEQEA